MKKHFEVIDRGECYRLLASEGFGRFGVIVEETPLILPMQFALNDEQIVLRTNPGAKFHSAPLTHVSFEVDNISLEREEGWSVVVQGVAVDITNAIDSRYENLRMLLPDSWAPEPKSCWLAIIPRIVSGRRLVARPVIELDAE